MDVGERDWGMIKQYVDLLTGCKIKLSCARERLTIDVHCFYNKKTEHPLQDTLHDRSVIIGFQKTQIYQRFAGSRQEVFILKIQNDENNAAQQDNGRRFNINRYRYVI